MDEPTRKYMTDMLATNLALVKEHSEQAKFAAARVGYYVTALLNAKVEPPPKESLGTAKASAQ